MLKTLIFTKKIIIKKRLPFLRKISMKKIIILIGVLFLSSLHAQQKELTLKSAVLGYSHGLYPESMSALQWADKATYCFKEGDTYILKNIEKNTETKITLANFQTVFPSVKHLPRLSKIKDGLMTFSVGSTYNVYNYKTKQKVSAISVVKEASNNSFNQKAGAVAYTIDNNLYIATANNPKKAITNFTDKNITAGQAIHRYEFGISKGIFWSPKGNYIAFYQKDETNVGTYPIVNIDTYPATVTNIKYPMAGQGSEQAKIGVYNVATGKTTYLDIDTTDEHYLTNLSWTPDEKQLLVAEVNRGQNHYDLNLYNIKNGKKVRRLLKESNDRWVEPENDAVFLPNSKTEFLWLSEKDGFKNLYLYNTKKADATQVTRFKFVIKAILGFDDTHKNVLVTATGKDGRETHVYRVNIETGYAAKITTDSGTHRAQLNGNYIIDNYSNFKTPRKINITNVVDGTSKNIFTADNPLQDYKMGTTTYETLKSPEGFDLYTRMIKPANFDATKKYPVLVYVYGGTHAQMITNSWLGGSRLWMHWLATQKDYIVYTLDNRGSGNRGFAFESVIHRKAGEAAMEDQIIGINHLKTLPYVDGNKIAVHGWSYGGFVTSSLLLRHPNVFTTGVAGGPVTDWKYYEVMYGERYMDTPQENPEGYKKARVGEYLKNLKGKLLLIHGSIDDVVVPQHSMTLLQEAVKKEVQLDFFTYPMHKHNVRGKDRVHLMHKVLNYILENNK